MEFENHKKIKNFISEIEKEKIINFVETLKNNYEISNHHIKNVSNELNGTSTMFDITKTEFSSKLSNFQSSNNISKTILPNIFFEIKDRISESLSISKDNVFLQILDSQKGGKIIPHYDSGFKNYITYKCNISVFSEQYKLYVEDIIINVDEKDLYSFEASLFKHWTDPFEGRRIVLSFGFILPIQELNRDENDFRVRLSNRIINNFQMKSI